MAGERTAETRPGKDRPSQRAGERLRDALPGAVRAVWGVTTVAETLAMVAVAVILLLFLLKDGPSIGRWMLGGTPARHRDRTRAAAVAGWKTLQGYVRGTAVIAATDAAGIGIGLLVLGVPLASPGPRDLRRVVRAGDRSDRRRSAGGAGRLATKGPVTALLTFGVVLLVQNLEGNLLQPLIVGRAVQLHPAVILVAVPAGAREAGIGGALLATPLSDVCHRVVLALRPHSGDHSDGSLNGQDTNRQDISERMRH